MFPSMENMRLGEGVLGVVLDCYSPQGNHLLFEFIGKLRGGW